MNRTLFKSKAFVRASKRLVRRDADSAAALAEMLSLLERDAFDPRLRTHKLAGDLEGCWAASAGYDLRVVFRFIEHEGTAAILLLGAGSHDEVY